MRRGQPWIRVGEGGPTLRLQPQNQQAVQGRVAHALSPHIPETDTPGAQSLEAILCVCLVRCPLPLLRCTLLFYYLVGMLITIFILKKHIVILFSYAHSSNIP